MIDIFAKFDTDHREIDVRNESIELTDSDTSRAVFIERLFLVTRKMRTSVYKSRNEPFIEYPTILDNWQFLAVRCLDISYFRYAFTNGNHGAIFDMGGARCDRVYKIHYYDIPEADEVLLRLL